MVATSAACPSAQRCEVVGLDEAAEAGYDGHADVGALATQVVEAGRLGAATDLSAPHESPSVGSLTCTGATTCAGGGSWGTYEDASTAVLLAEHRGVWHVDASFLSDRNVGHAASVTALACTAAGSCVAIGSYAAWPRASALGDADPVETRPFVVVVGRGGATSLEDLGASGTDQPASVTCPGGPACLVTAGDPSGGEQVAWVTPSG